MLRKSKLLIIFFVITVLFLLFMTPFIFWEASKGVQNSDWSREGEWIAFSCTSGDLNVESSIYLTRPDGSTIQRLTNEKMVARFPTWSPDGEEIAFVGTVDGKGGIYKLKRGNDTPIAIIKPDRSTAELDIAWLPDGQWIAFVSRHGVEETTIFRIKPDGSRQEPIITEKVGERIAEPITWSPDGQWIAFSFVRSFYNFGIYKTRVDGSDAAFIPNTLTGEFPAWDPNGQKIAFVRGNIFLVQKDGSQLQQITDLPEVPGSLAWSPDGKWIVFAYRSGKFMQLFKIRIEGSEFQQITHMNCNAMMPDWISMTEN